MREIGIPTYEMYVSRVSTFDGRQSSCLRQISYVYIIIAEKTQGSATDQNITIIII